MLKSFRATLCISSLLLGLKLGIAVADEPVATDARSTTQEKSSIDEEAKGADGESPLVLSSFERGQQLLAERRYDEAIKEFQAAHDLEPTTETHVGMAMAMLRGRQVLQRGELCDPRSYRDELRPHHQEAAEQAVGCSRGASSTYERRIRELTYAIEHLESATKMNPDNLEIYKRLVATKIVLSQFEEETSLRGGMREVEYASESIAPCHRFELPSLSFSSEEMFPMELGR